MIPEAVLLLAAMAGATLAAALYGTRRRSAQGWQLFGLLAMMLVVELARTLLAPVPGRAAASADNMLLLVQLVWPLAAVELVLLGRTAWVAAAALAVLETALVALGGALEPLYWSLEVVIAVGAAALACIWQRGRASTTPPERGALAIVAASLVGLLWLAMGDDRQAWATNGKVWAWVMLLIAMMLLGGCWRRSEAR